MESAFERGADAAQTVAALHDPAPAAWIAKFRSNRIDGVFLIAGSDEPSVTFLGNTMRAQLSGSINVVYSEIGTVRPGQNRGREHFGFMDGISQPGIRGLTRPSRPYAATDQGLPGQDLVWPGEFVLGYPGQDSQDPEKPGRTAPLPAPWARNGSYMVFRRLEQRVPEFRSYVGAQAVRLGIYPELLAARMVGRWRSGRAAGAGRGAICATTIPTTLPTRFSAYPYAAVAARNGPAVAAWSLRDLTRLLARPWGTGRAGWTSHIPITRRGAGGRRSKCRSSSSC
jgi:deferrochelatase/peroxidase EfeB